MRWWRGLGFLLTVGCYKGGGGYGAIVGGAQDIGYARDVIASGGVPDPAAFPVEGLFAEHDIPTSGAPCADLLCARPSIGRAPWLEGGGDATWVQLGMTSGMPVPYERPPLDLVVVIDRSSPMQVDLDEVETAVIDVIGQLSSDDRLGVVAFNGNVDVLHDLASVADPDALAHDVRGLSARGDFEPIPAMETAYRMFDGLRDDGTRLRRVMLLTCGYATGEPFDTLVREGAEAHVGTSVIGVLLGWSAATSDLLGTTHGGAFRYTASLEEVERLFVDDFDFHVSPIAYDLRLGLTMDDAWGVEATYGAPGDADPSRLVEVNTAFLSRQRGATFLRVAPVSSDGEGGITVASRVGTVSLDFVPEPAHGFPASSEGPVDLALPPDGEPASDGVKKGAALVNQAEQMSLACQDYAEGRVDDAIARLEVLQAHLQDVRDALGDDALTVEVDLVAQLAANMRE